MEGARKRGRRGGSVFVAVAGMEDGIGEFDFLGRRGTHIFEGVWNSEGLPFEHAEGVVGEDFDAFDGGTERIDEIGGFSEDCLVGCDTWDEDVPDPHRVICFGEETRHIEDIAVAVSGQFPMGRRIDVFDIQHEQIGFFGDFPEGGKEWLVSGKGFAGGIDAGIDILTFGEGKKFQQKVGLEERLAAADGDTALFAPVIAVAHGVLQDLLRGFLAEGVGACPRIGVVAVFAPHETAPEKDDIADTGAIGAAEGFGRMDQSN